MYPSPKSYGKQTNNKTPTVRAAQLLVLVFGRMLVIVQSCFNMMIGDLRCSMMEQSGDVMQLWLDLEGEKNW